jgi:hypothetical protein
MKSPPVSSIPTPQSDTGESNTGDQVITPPGVILREAKDLAFDFGDEGAPVSCPLRDVGNSKTSGVPQVRVRSLDANLGFSPAVSPLPFP